MFTKLDDILFPNKVEIVYFPDQNKYIYPIFKNGSSSIYNIQKENNYKLIVNEQIKKLTDIDVFLRDPEERYRSGFQTYIYENPKLDYQTLLYLGEQGYIFDRHILPQFCWLINLMRYMSPDAKIHIHNMQMLSYYTSGRVAIPKKSNVESPMGPNLEMYMRLDNLMLNDLTGQSWTPNQIMTHLMSQDPMAYFTVIGKTQKLAEVTHVLPTP